MQAVFVFKKNFFLVVINFKFFVVDLTFALIKWSLDYLIGGGIFLLMFNCRSGCIEQLSSECFQIGPLFVFNALDWTLNGQAQVRQLGLFGLIVSLRNVVPFAIFLVKMEQTLGFNSVRK